MIISPEVTIILAAAAGAVGGNLFGVAVKLIDGFVRGTPTRLDDKVWVAVRGAMSEAMEGWEEDDKDDEGT